MSSTHLSPATAVLLLSLFCGFMLKTSAGYALCWLVARFATSARARFAVWCSFLLSSAFYWIFLCIQAFGEAVAPGSTQTSIPSTILPGSRVMLSAPSASLLGRLLPSAAFLYALFLGVMLLVGLWKRIQIYRVLRYRIEPPASLAAVFRSLASEVQAPPCRLWLLPGLSSPAYMGGWRPAVYLPLEPLEDAQEGTAGLAGLHDILCHELSHVRRRDGLWETAARACRCILFFQPAVHRALSALRLERELACDMAVVRRHPEQRDLYAETLVRLGWKTSLAGHPDRLGIGFTSQAAVLKVRVSSILQGERVTSRWTRGSRAVLTAASCWSFATVLPALWIGFQIAANPTAQDLPQAANLNPVKLPHRRAKPPAPSLVASSAPKVRLSSPPVVLVGASAFSPLRTPAFHVQNTDEPMFNSTPDPEMSVLGRASEPTGPTTGPDPRNRSASRSPQAVVIRTASQAGIGAIASQSGARGMGHKHGEGQD